MTGGRVTSAAVAAAGAADARFTVEFRAADGAWQRGPLMSCVGVRFEDVPPVRPFRFEKGLRNFAGWWYFATTGTHVGFESWLERPVDRTNPGTCRLQASPDIAERNAVRPS
jgi:hypothetical protein